MVDVRIEEVRGREVTVSSTRGRVAYNYGVGRAAYSDWLRAALYQVAPNRTARLAFGDDTPVALVIWSLDALIANAELDFCLMLGRDTEVEFMVR